MKKENLTIYDAVLAVFYVIIILAGIVMCVNHGLGATLFHLVVITVSVWGVFAAKFLKYRSEIRCHLGEFVFIGFMGIVSLLALVGTIL